MKAYLGNLNMILNHGDYVYQRNSSTYEMFGIKDVYFNIGDEFPLLTTKAMPFKTMVAELLCFIRGYTDVRDFQNMGVNFWNKNATSDYWKANPNYKEHSLGRIYGAQWRDYISPNGSHIDQLKNLINGLIEEPHGRRHIVNAWNPGELDKMCLPPCHCFFQCNVDSKGRLNLLMYQRSCDMFLGVPFNIASYALLQLIICHQTGYEPGNFTHMMGSAHIYESHVDQCKEQLRRSHFPLPMIYIDKDPGCNLEDYEVDDFELIGYQSHPAIKADMIV